MAVWTEWGDGRLVSAESTAESAVGDADGITARKKHSINWPWKRKQRGTLVLSMDFDVISGKSKMAQYIPTSPTSSLHCCNRRVRYNGC